MRDLPQFIHPSNKISKLAVSMDTNIPSALTQGILAPNISYTFLLYNVSYIVLLQAHVSWTIDSLIRKLSHVTRKHTNLPLRQTFIYVVKGCVLHISFKDACRLYDIRIMVVYVQESNANPNPSPNMQQNGLITI